MVVLAQQKRASLLKRISIGNQSVCSCETAGENYGVLRSAGVEHLQQSSLRISDMLRQMVRVGSEAVTLGHNNPHVLLHLQDIM